MDLARTNGRQRAYRLSKSALKTPGADDYPIIELDDFTIYRPKDDKQLPAMRALSDFKTRRGDSSYLFDGTLRFEDVEHRVQGVPFETLSADGYGTNSVTVASKIWIQSLKAERYNAWYILKQPAPEYARFHVPFLWLADFTKHFVGYLDHREDLQSVKLHDFKSDFYNWLATQYQDNWRFRSWHKMFRDQKDFRTVIAANFDYLWKEAVSVQEDNQGCFLWREVDAKSLSAVPLQPLHEQNTIVTPYIYDCFKDMYFASAMESRNPAKEVQIAALKKATAFEVMANMSEVVQDTARLDPSESQSQKLKISAGDVVQIDKDVETPWKSVADSWYAYVLGCETGMDGDKVLRVIWLYLPEDTTCAQMKYPFRRELFFSDHCNCGAVNLSISDVLRKVKVKFSRDQKGDNFDFFVRQTYITDSKCASYASFITFRRSHMRCDCRDPQPRKLAFKAGQTVLIAGLTKDRLEPAVLIDTTNPRKLQIRRLSRKHLHHEEAKANELVYTDVYDYVTTNQVKRSCHVRCYTPGQVAQREVPAPYSYNGTGDCWILTGRLRAGSVEPISTCPKDMIEGFDPKSTASRRKLKGLSLFCGGGSFDRGFEESGAVEFTHSVDWAQMAVHTCRANAENPDKLNLFYGNVNDYLGRAFLGDKASVIAKIGDIGFMTAGSPCVAFSLLQPDAMSQSSLRNASLVAALAAAVDVYRPEYGVFENVFPMARNMGPNRDENVLSQMVAAFVGMGYQVQVFNQDAHCTGSGEQRSRLLLAITAPGLQPLSKPSNTHSHPDFVKERTVGKASNGIPFGQRLFEETPFDFRTTAQTIGDLPDIGGAEVNMCIPYPDHRRSALGNANHLRIKHIPRFPYGCSWVSAVKMGYMPQGVINDVNRASKMWLSEKNRAFGRVYPHGQIPTIITRVTPDCAMNGRALHYDQPRTLTVMEARRTQSYPDHEVLIGGASAQWKIVGNSVDRTMAAAAGVSLRFAWLANDPDYPRFVNEYVLDDNSRVVLPDVPLEVNNKDEDISSEEDVVKLPGRVDSSKKLNIKSPEPESDDDLVIVRRLTVADKRKSVKEALVKLRAARKSRQSLPARFTAQLEPRTRESTDELGGSFTIDTALIKPVATGPSTLSRRQDSLTSTEPQVEPKRTDPIDRHQVYVLVPSTQAAASGPVQSAPALHSVPSSVPTATPTPAVPVAAPRSAPAAAPSFFAKFAAPRRSPTTGRILPRVTPSTTTRRSQNSPTAPKPIANSARRMAAMQTSGLLSPAPSGNASPAAYIIEPTSAVKQPAVVKAPFSTLAQRSPSRHESDDDEDELSIHVDNALAITDTSLLGVDVDVTVKDVFDEAREHVGMSADDGDEDVGVGASKAKISSSAIAGAEDTDSDWMDYELTG